MTDDPAILAARAQVIASKTRLDSSIATVKAKLSPRSMAADALESATDKAASVAHGGLQIARERPGAVAAAAGLVALALARKPLFGWVGALFDRSNATADDDAS